MRNTVISILTKQAKNNKNIILLTGDLGFGVLDKFKESMPKQFFNLGICEQSMASIAAGLALEGKKVYYYSIGNFPTLRCVEQIRNDICYHNADVKIIAVGGGFAYGSLGMSHHATEDIAIMRSLPNMQVFSPADPCEAAAIMENIVTLDQPCYIRINKGGEPNINFVATKSQDRTVYDAVCRRIGEDICILTTGAITFEAIFAADALKEEGISVAVYDFPCVKPLDRKTLQKLAYEYPFIITVEEHNIVGGFGSAIAEVISEFQQKAILIRLGLNDTYSSVVGSQSFLRGVYGIDCKNIISKVKELLASKVLLN